MKVLWISAALLTLTGCSSQESEKAPPENSPAAESKDAAGTAESKPANETEEKDMEKTNSSSSEESTQTNSASDATETASEKQGKEVLSQYSNEEIEYSRVWLQLGPNQDIDGLYVQHIPAGTPLNPDDDTSGTYPEDVIQLAGSRLVDGSVTYSGNGDGTINVYNVPLRWDGEYPAGEEFYAEIIDNTELVSVDVGKDEEVVRLINLLNVSS